MAEVSTLKVVDSSQDGDGWKIINEADFVKGKDQLYGEGKASKPKK